MRTRAAKKKEKTVVARRRQVNVRVEPELYRLIETVARQERRSIPQAARRLMEEGLRCLVGRNLGPDETSGDDIARLAAGGGAFDWLGEEPDLYDDSSGEPV
ncbi:MAG: hypothetical protein ACE5HV_18385 [Acidobacteriota bacterium]